MDAFVLTLKKENSCTYILVRKINFNPLIPWIQYILTVVLVTQWMVIINTSKNTCMCLLKHNKIYNNTFIIIIIKLNKNNFLYINYKKN